MKRRNQKYIIVSKLMKLKITKKNQKYISASKLIKLKRKRSQTRLIIIVIDIFPFFLP